LKRLRDQLTGIYFQLFAMMQICTNLYSSKSAVISTMGWVEAKNRSANF